MTVSGYVYSTRGVDPEHPAVGEIEKSVVVESDDEGVPFVREEGETGDLFGHGTACAGIIRKIAPDSEIASVRVLGKDNRGNGAVMAAGLKWAIEQGYRVINMSLSTTRHDLSALLHDLIDDGWYRRTVIFASAHNRSVTSYPWRFSSVFSVGSHEEEDPLAFFSNPEPAGRILRQGRRPRSRVAERFDDLERRQQLRDRPSFGNRAPWCWPNTRNSPRVNSRTFCI